MMVEIAKFIVVTHYVHNLKQTPNEKDAWLYSSMFWGGFVKIIQPLNISPDSFLPIPIRIFNAAAFDLSGVDVTG